MKKGFTVVELIVSFSLTMVIVVFLFQIVISLKNMYTANSLKTELLNKQAIISDKINSSFSKKTITNVTKCGSYCLNFIYSDNSSEMLKINYTENSFQFGSYKTLLPDNSYMSNPSIDIVYSGTFLEDSNNSILVINIPIYSDFLKNQNYGINVMYQYNSNDYDLYLPGFNDYDGKYGYLQLNGARNLVIDSLEKYNESGYKVFDSNGEEISDANVRVNNPFANMEIPYQTGVYKIEYSLIYEDVAIETLYRYVTVTDAVADFDYTGSEKIFIAPLSGYYKLEAWGAQGGTANTSYYGGAGGYSTGMVYLEKGQTLYINVGGQGISKKGNNQVIPGGYNGGGSTISTNYNEKYENSSGGGATHIAYQSGLLSELNGDKESILLVAAGGGGGSYWDGYFRGKGGAGGGAKGSDAVFIADNSAYYTYGTGATQTAGGHCIAGASYNLGLFGTAATNQYISNVNANATGGGGGGGYYGGGGGCQAGQGGGGGSSFFGDVLDGKTISGTEKIPTHDGQGTMTGNSGNGYAKITYIGESLE